MVATYFQISGCYCQISGYYCKIGGYLPKSLETPLYRGLSQREVWRDTSLIPPLYLPHTSLATGQMLNRTNWNQKFVLFLRKNLQPQNKCCIFAPELQKKGKRTKGTKL